MSSARDRVWERAGKPGKNPAPERSTARLAVRAVADVTRQTVEWLWHGRVPFGMLTFLDGDPGLGKSCLALDLAARLTTGRPMPFDDGGPRSPSPVLLLCGEDSPGHTIRPRLEAAGADLTLCHLIDGLMLGGVEQPVTFPCDLAMIEEEIGRLSARLLVADPVMGFVGGGVDTHNDGSARTALDALRRVAGRTGAAVLCLRHLNKRNGEAALYRGGGSIAFTAAARSVLAAGRHPHEADTLVLASAKLNVGRTPPAVTYTVEPQDGQPVIRWGGECDLTPDDIVTRATRRPGEATADAAGFLRRELANGAARASVLEAAAREEGISKSSLRRAKDALGVESRKVGFAGNAGWEWSLPAAEAAAGANEHSGLFPEDRGLPD